MDKEHLIEGMKENGALRSAAVERAFRSVDRAAFVPELHKMYTYSDDALPIGENATISQPTTIAIMLEALELARGQRVLEVGSGSGYVLALIYKITGVRPTGLEVNKELAERSRTILKQMKVPATVVVANGWDGFDGPWDRILVSASAESVPEKLLASLAGDGVMVLPLGGTMYSEMTVLKKEKGKILKKNLGTFAFVQLVKDK